jgi:8-oxo-dGTP diphosphatase
MIHAAGILFMAPSGKILLLRRAAGEDHAGTWALPGGKVRDGESRDKAAVRETLEETGFNPGYVGKWHTRRVKDGVDYVVYINNVENEFSIQKLNAEHDAWKWILPDEALSDHEASK